MRLWTSGSGETAHFKKGDINGYMTSLLRSRMILRRALGHTRDGTACKEISKPLHAIQPNATRAVDMLGKNVYVHYIE